MALIPNVNQHICINTLNSEYSNSGWTKILNKLHFYILICKKILHVLLWKTFIKNLTIAKSDIYELHGIPILNLFLCFLKNIFMFLFLF